MIDWQLVLAVLLVIVAASYLSWRSLVFVFQTNETCGGCNGCNSRVMPGQTNTEPVYQIELTVQGKKLQDRKLMESKLSANQLTTTTANSKNINQGV